MAANPFATSSALVQEVSVKAAEIGKGKSLEEAGLDPKWLRSYGLIAKRCRDAKDFGVIPYPLEQGPGIGALTGGSFEHREWLLRRAMENYFSFRAVAEYGANYVNAAGYRMDLHEAALDLRKEAIVEKDNDAALQCDVWAGLSNRYGLRVIGLRAEFYKMSPKDPTCAKLVMLTLERRNEMAAADDLQESMSKMETHLSTQLMKEVATLSASHATKRASKGGAAGEKKSN